MLDDKGEPTIFLHVLVGIYKITGKKHFEEIWINKAFAALSEYMKRLSEKAGGHPIDDKTALIIILLASGIPYKEVMNGMRQYELTTAEAGDSRPKVIDRARKRVERVEKLLLENGIKIQYQDNKFKGFFEKVAQMPESEEKFKLKQL